MRTDGSLLPTGAGRFDAARASLPPDSRANLETGPQRLRMLSDVPDGRSGPKETRSGGGFSRGDELRPVRTCSWFLQPGEKACHESRLAGVAFALDERRRCSRYWRRKWRAILAALPEPHRYANVWVILASIRIPAKKLVNASCPCSGSTCETYWSGRTTTMQPVSRFTPRSSKTSSAVRVGAEHLLVVDQAELALPRQQDRRHLVDAPGHDAPAGRWHGHRSRSRGRHRLA